MVALHIPVSHYAEWAEAMAAATFHAVPGQIVIGSSAPASYAPTIVHKPLRASDMFFLWRNKEAPRPTHNAFALAARNHVGKWRGLWSDLQVLQSSVFNKQPKEALMRSDSKPGLEQVDKVVPSETSFFGNEADTESCIPEFINTSAEKIAKKRAQMWREAVRE